jgi:hypothetical protein
MRGNIIANLDDYDQRLEFLSLVRPFLQLSPSIWRMDWNAVFGAESDGLEDVDQVRFSSLAEADVDLVGGDIADLIVAEIEQIGSVDRVLSEVADELTSLLKTALDLFAVVGEANTEEDPSIHAQPSITPHPQNRRFHRWTHLIDLLWRAWLYIDSQSPSDSRKLVNRWLAIPYPAFRRLSLAALRQSTAWNPDEKLAVLVNE